MERIIIDGLSFSLPLFIMAVGGIYSEKSGVINLALEGFQGMGAFCGALAVILLQGLSWTTPGLCFYAALLFAMLGGALYSLFHAFLSIRLKANQVISGVVLNILAASLTAYMTRALNRSLFGAPSDKFVLGVSDRVSVPGLSRLPFLGAVFKDLYPFEILIVILTAILWYLLYRTRFGMNLRAAGDNPHALDAAGENVARVRTLAVMVSGMLSGLAGISFAYSISGTFSFSVFSGYGYLAIAAMIFGNWSILTTLGSCLLFGFARSGGYTLVQKLKMPSSYADLVMTLPYVLTLLLLVFFSKYNRAPRALGEIYDKGKR